MLKTTNYNDVFKFVKTYWQRLFKIVAKYYHFIVEKNDFVHIANVKKNTINDEHIVFSLHKNFVSKNQFRNFEKNRSICIFFDVANALVIEIKKNLNRTWTISSSSKKITTISKKIIVKTILFFDRNLIITMF